MLAIYLLIENRFEKTLTFGLYHRTVLIAVGLVLELLFRYVGLTNFPSPDYFVPSWLLLVWLSFGFTFNGCYSWLTNYSHWIAALLGAIFGPITYWIASRLAPFEILEPVSFTLFSSLFWGTFFGISVRFIQIKLQRAMKQNTPVIL